MHGSFIQNGNGNEKKTYLSSVNFSNGYLFVPICSQGDPQQNGRLHASSSYHTTPNTLPGHK
jgi:hypothetical protein